MGLSGRVGELAAQRPRTTAIRYKSRGRWHDVSWADLDARVKRVAGGLAALGVAPGDRVVVGAPASPAWLVAILGVDAAGAIPFSVYQALAPEDLGHLFEQAGATAAIGEVGWFEMLLSRGVKLPDKVVFTDNQRPAAWAGGDVVMLTDVEKRAGGALAAGNPELPLLFSTAGASGRPRIVAHASASLMAASEALTGAGGRPLGRSDSAVVELPTGHPGALITAIGLPLACGLVAHLPELRPSDAVRDVHPTFSMNVPSRWERLAARIQVAARFTRGVKGVVFRGGQRLRRVAFDPTSPIQSARGPLAHLAYAGVFMPLLLRLGVDRLRAAYVVGRVSPDLLSIWRAWGVELTAAYGLAEAAPVVGTIAGRAVQPAPGCELQVGAGDRLQVRGPALAEGWWADGKVTAFTDAGGWYETGDVAEAGPDGIRVRGPASDLAKVDDAVVALSEFDAALTSSPFVRAAHTEERAGKLQAKLDLDYRTIARWATATGVSYRTPAALAESTEVERLLAQELEDANRRLAAAKLPAISGFEIAPAPFAVGHEITPTGAIRRHRTAREGRSHAGSEDRHPPLSPSIGER